MFMYRDESANMPAVTYRRKRPDSTYSSLSAEVTYGNRPKSEAVYAIAGMGADVSTDPTTRRGTDWDESNYGLSGQAAEERDAIYGLANTSNRDSQVYGAPLSDAERSDGFYGNRGADDRENEGECEELDTPFTRNIPLQLARVDPGTASLILKHAPPSAARPSRRTGWLTRSCFPAAPLAPSQTPTASRPIPLPTA